MRGRLSPRLRTLGVAAGAAILTGVTLIALPVCASAGTYKWAKTWAPRPGYNIFQARLAAAPLGGVYAATTPCSVTHVASGMAVARYTSSGACLWAKMLTKASHSAMAAVAADRWGDPIVLGYGPAKTGGTAWQLIKLSPAGKQLWHVQLRGVRSAGNMPGAMAVDAAGNIYVCGQVVRVHSGTDATLAKFSAGGKLLWAEYLDGSAHGDDCATTLARDAAGRIYVTGYVKDVGTGDDVFVARYSATGHRDWLRIWDNRMNSGDDYAWAIAASRAGVAVAGSTDGTWDNVNGEWDTDGLVVAYAPNSNLRYEWEVPGADPEDEFYAVSFCPNGAVAAAGGITTAAPGNMYKAVLLVLSPAPKQLLCDWLPNTSCGAGFDAMTSSAGTILAAGFVGTANGSSTYLCRVTAGLQTTMATYSSGAGTTNVATDVLCRGSATYVAGEAGSKMGLVRF